MKTDFLKLLVGLTVVLSSRSSDATDTQTINERVLAVRKRLTEKAAESNNASVPDTACSSSPARMILAQWINWGNWGNWNNWNNWPNWNQFNQW
jgi:hypothetical protein